MANSQKKASVLGTGRWTGQVAIKIQKMQKNNPPRNYRKGTFVLLLLVVFLAITFLLDYIRISGYETLPVRPEEAIDLRVNELYYQLANGEEAVDWGQLEGGLEYIRNEYDCADFRLVNLIRILYEAGDRMPDSYRKQTQEVLFDFRYWWDEPGENSMCYWSENHQILFASAEYLIGQKYPDRVFSNSGLTGSQHVEKARKRILDWLEMRWNYGFTEFYSGTYYVEDIAALINLIDFAGTQILIQVTNCGDNLFIIYEQAVTLLLKARIRSTTAALQERIGGERYHGGQHE